MSTGGRSPLLVAVVGGSGSGKTWFAERLCSLLSPNAARLSADDFYRDRSAVPMRRRARVNFDHPRAIDWAELERAVRALATGKPARVPRYDFSTHARKERWRRCRPKPVLVLEGLWLLRRLRLRRLFALTIFLDCPAGTRFRRRLERDRQCRGRDAGSIRKQFRGTVQPMHARFITPQIRRADIVLRHGWGEAEVQEIALSIRAAMRAGGGWVRGATGRAKGNTGDHFPSPEAWSCSPGRNIRHVTFQKRKDSVCSAPQHPQRLCYEN